MRPHLPEGPPIGYGQCWEDADVLLRALDVRPGQTCLSIASAGDNTLAMLSRSPDRVIAIDRNPSQLACLELRVAAYRALSHSEVLELIGSVPSARRRTLYRRCRERLKPEALAFWDARPGAIDRGIGNAGRFEGYLASFRGRVLPLVHSRDRVAQLFDTRSRGERTGFHDRVWNSWRWRILFRLFFSRLVMSRLGRDPRCFAHVDGGVAGRLLRRARHGVTELDPRKNPYLQWILTGRHTGALPYALRPEHFEAIRGGLDRLECHCQSLEDFLESYGGPPIDRYNLSDIFEYLSQDEYHRLLKRLVAAGRQGSRLVYWNLFVARTRPEGMAARLRPLTELASNLHRIDKCFFYGRLVIEEVA